MPMRADVTGADVTCSWQATDTSKKDFSEEHDRIREEDLVLCRVMRTPDTPNVENQSLKVYFNHACLLEV